MFLWLCHWLAVAESQSGEVLVATCRRTISAFQEVLVCGTVRVAGGKEKGCGNLKCVQMGGLTVGFGLDKAAGVGEQGALCHWGLWTLVGTGISPNAAFRLCGGLSSSSCFMLAALVMFMHSVVQAKAHRYSIKHLQEAQSPFSTSRGQKRGWGDREESLLPI